MGKRGRKPSNKRKGYFYEDEENAVIDYLAATNIDEKNAIYNAILKPAFTKMIESIIRRYNLYIPDEDFNQTFEDTMSFLVTKLNNYDPEKGKKAYSYCGTVCKNHLIYKVNQFNKMQKRVLPFDNVVNELSDDIKLSNEIDNNSSNFITELIEKTIIKINNMLLGKNNINLNENERKIGKALVVLLENWEDVLSMNGSVKLNKSAVLFFLRDSTNLSTKELRDGMKKFKIGYYNTKKILLN